MTDLARQLPRHRQTTRAANVPPNRRFRTSIVPGSGRVIRALRWFTNVAAARPTAVGTWSVGGAAVEVLSLPGSTLGGARRVRAERWRVRHVIGFIIFLIVIGFVAGLLARLLVPGPDSMSVLQTWLLGVVGSFIGGFIGYLLFRNDDEDGWVQPAGFIGSVIGAVIALLAYRAMQRRRITR
jgi:uncharacterized membrane protein YeaQ/YmgE (transglycosylase-associated protein family)